MILAADPRAAGLLAPLLLALVLAACSPGAPPVELAGDTMGTTWHATYVPQVPVPSHAALQGGIEALLERVNASMSTYRPDSEISRFNRAPAGAWVEVSAPFMTVLTAALGVGAETGGAYDVTVGPLVELWGFGAGGRGASVPGEEAIARARARTGAGHLRLDAAGGRVFKGADVALDFSSLAKGYAVDRVSDYLLQAGVSRHLVEIGGELRGRGTRPGGDPWRIAVEKPSAGAREPARIIDVTDIAVATSGDYRNFFEIDGQRYSHSIDPRSGYPVDHDLVSVTVLHDSAMLADAWATALVVLGYNAASRLSGQFGLAAFFIRRSEGGFEEAASPAFSAYIK